MSSRYLIRLHGRLGAAAQEAFRDLGIEVEPTTTVLRADLQPTELHRVLDRVRDLGLDVLEIRRLDRPGS